MSIKADEYAFWMTHPKQIAEYQLRLDLITEGMPQEKIVLLKEFIEWVINEDQSKQHYVNTYDPN